MTVVSPGAVGMRAPALGHALPTMERFVACGEIPGAVLLVQRKGQLVLSETAGMMDIEGRVPMARDTIFRLYSMTKPILSAALMMLESEGKLQLADAVSAYIPAFKSTRVYAGRDGDKLTYTEPKRPISIFDLLTHTSGISYGDFADSPVDAMYREAGLDWENDQPNIELAELVRRIASVPLLFHPGEEWRYGFSVDVVGHLIEVISGVPADVFVEERICKPLGMSETTFLLPEAKRSRLAKLYTPTGTGQLAHSTSRRFDPCMRGRPPTSIGMLGTAADFMRFASCMANFGQLDGVRLWSRKTVELMTRNVLPSQLLPLPHMVPRLPSVDSTAARWSDGEGRMLDRFYPRCGFGLGFGTAEETNNSPATVGSFWWGGAAQTWFWVDRKEELVIVFMTHIEPAWKSQVHFRLLSVIYGAIDD